MGNAFDSTYYPEREPLVLLIGDRWAWKRTDLGSDYPPASYALKYSFRLQGTTATEIEITASESGSDYIVEVASATTAGYTAGDYEWQMYVTRSSDSERVTLATGFTQLVPNQDAAATDPRSHAAKMVDYLETVIEALAQKRAGSYAINGRSVTFRDLEELKRMRQFYAAEVEAEQAKARIADGRKGRRPVIWRHAS